MVRTALVLCLMTACGGTQRESDEPMVNYECTDETASARTERPFPSPAIDPTPMAPIPSIGAAALERDRLTGNRSILPDDRTKDRMRKMGIDMLSATFTICVDATGMPTIIDRQYSSCFPPYDEKLRDTMRTWRYKPRAQPVCSTVTFVYETRNHR